MQPCMLLGSTEMYEQRQMEVKAHDANSINTSINNRCLLTHQQKPHDRASKSIMYHHQHHACAVKHYNTHIYHSHHTTTVLWLFFQDLPGEPVPEKNFWTLRCKRRLTEAETLTIWLGATPSRLTSSHLHHPPIFYRPDALPATQPTVSKHWRHTHCSKLWLQILAIT